MFDKNGMNCAHIFYIRSHHFFNMSLVWINLCLHDKTLYTLHVFVILSNTHTHTHTNPDSPAAVQYHLHSPDPQDLRYVSIWCFCFPRPLWWFLLSASQRQGSTEIEGEYTLVSFLRLCLSLSTNCKRQPDTGHVCTISGSHSSGWSCNDAVFSTRILCESCQRHFQS